jgi:glycosyltransferase involved in cell wall biosynthesis
MTPVDREQGLNRVYGKICPLQYEIYIVKTILHVIDTTGPGGAETVFIDLITGLPRDKFKSIVLIRGKGWVYETLRKHGIQPILLDAKGSFNWRYLVNILKLLKSKKVDLIQSHLLGSNIYCSMAGLLSRTPVVATFHGSVDIGINERLKSLKFGIINVGANKVIAVSHNLKNSISKGTTIRASKLTVIYNGIATSDFDYPRDNTIRTTYGWNNDDIVIGCLGNIRPAKGYDHLLRTASLLKEKSPRFRFVIAGQGNNRLHENLMAQQNQLGLEDHVKFLGFSDNPGEFLSNLDVFLLSSITEGFSIATIQAMATGLPVVATKSGGPEEIVTHGKNGWLVEAGNDNEMADTLMQVVNNMEYSREIARHGKSHAISTFDVEDMIGSYIGLYNSYLR